MEYAHFKNKYKTIRMKKKIYYLLLLTFYINCIAQESHLDSYIREGLESNLAIQQKQAGYEKSIAALKEARGLFFPNISFDARYSVAEGGRTIDIPVDQMLNSVYQNLNAINDAMALINPMSPFGQIPDYPVLEPQTINFLRPTEHETKLRIVQPVVNSKIFYNNKIKNDLANAEKADYNSYKRQLIAEIKTAYFNYLQSLEYKMLLNETESLVNENLRINKKLAENDKVTLDIVFRAETEVAKIQKLQAEANKNINITQSYFNFLINRPLNSFIEIDSLIETNILEYSLNNALNSAIAKREELQMLEYYRKAATHSVYLNRLNSLPTVNCVLDYGFQGEEYVFTDEYDYVMASVVLRWDLFTGMQNKQKTQKAKIDQHIADMKMQEAENQLSLQVINSYYNLEASYKEILFAESEVKSAVKAFEIMNKKYLQGQASLIEYIDARTNMTNSQHSLIVSKYTYQVKKAEFERIACINDYIY